MVTKLFHLFPQQGNDETIAYRIVAYCGELADIHVDVLRPALRRLWRDHKRGSFLPTVAEIRRAAALVVRHARAGRDAMTPEHADPSTTEPNVERLLQLAPKPHEPCPYPQLAGGGTAFLQLEAGAA